ncbi:MAG: hypothetical protein GY757_03750 [bacterium]|nr:hypothetical protein [bacterium]
MIPVKKDYHKPPAILLKENCKEKIRQAVIEEKGDIDTTYYKHPHVRKILEEDIYHGKCCYCESEIDHAATLQVEHYRPKKGLNPEKEGDEKHKGYYWLASEWSNLLLSCQKCNRVKGNYFPISGKRVSHDSPFSDNDKISTYKRVRQYADAIPLKAELPLLLNPEEKEIDTEEHFRFNKSFKMEGLTERGGATINICNLNRNSLVVYRSKFIRHIFEQIERAITKKKQKRISAMDFRERLLEEFDELKERRKAGREYSLLAKFVYNNFEAFSVPFIIPEHRGAIIEAFDSYRESGNIQSKK